MVRDAEEHAAEDAAKRDLATLKNQADSAAYGAEAALKEHDAKLEADEKAKLEAAIGEVKKALAGEDKAAIQSALDGLNAASAVLAEAAKREAPAAGPGSGAASDGPEVVEGEIVDDKK